MPYKFTQEPVSTGLYEPEGIYLEVPFSQNVDLVQHWGGNPDFYAQYRYFGTTLKGYIGLGFEISPGAPVLSVDRGRISEISVEKGGFELYVKLEHRWGESLYCFVRKISVEAGQYVDRGVALAKTGGSPEPFVGRFHLGIRIHPYNRYDGWGGFSDPLPFLNPEFIRNQTFVTEPDDTLYPPLPMATETATVRRP